MATDSPFDDTIFVSRLQKLLSMLGSEQPGEADTARRKLLEHLGHHRLSLTDVATRLREPPRPAAQPFAGGLERQLQVARVARQDAEFDVHRARQRVAELNQSLQEAGFDVSRAQRGQARARLWGALGWLLALVAGLALLVPRLEERARLADQVAARNGQALLHPAPPDAVGQSPAHAPGERTGTVLVQDLAVRLSPTSDGEVRAFLNRGTRVVLIRQMRFGAENWLLIRSVSGAGWVRSSDVLH